MLCYAAMRRFGIYLFSAVIVVFSAAIVTACGTDSVGGDEPMDSRALELADAVDGLLESLPPHMAAARATAPDDAFELERAFYDDSVIRLEAIRDLLWQLDACVTDSGDAPDTTELWRLHDAAGGEAANHLLVIALAGDDLEVEGYRSEELTYQLQMTEAMSALRAQPIYNPAVTDLYTCPPPE